MEKHIKQGIVPLIMDQGSVGEFFYALGVLGSINACAIGIAISAGRIINSYDSRKHHREQEKIRIKGKLEDILSTMPDRELERAIRAYDLLRSLPDYMQGEILDKYDPENAKPIPSRNYAPIGGSPRPMVMN